MTSKIGSKGNISTTHLGTNTTTAAGPWLRSGPTPYIQAPPISNQFTTVIRPLQTQNMNGKAIGNQFTVSGPQFGTPRFYTSTPSGLLK